MTTNYILIEINNITMAFPSSKISIVGTGFDLKKLAYAPSFMLGMEQTLEMPVIDIFDLYHIDALRCESSSLLVKVSLWLEHENTKSLEVGLLVDKFLGTIDVDPITIHRFRPDLDIDQSGIIQIGNKKICVLNIDNLFNRTQIKELCTYLISINSKN